MTAALEVDQVVPGIFIWQIYDESVKADLSSTGLETVAGTWLVDPTPLAAKALDDLRSQQKISAIFITNTNHGRAARQFATAFAVPVFVHASLSGTEDFPNTMGVQDGKTISGGLTGIAIDGGPAGEMALHCEDGGGTVVMGDALINFEPHGFDLLPAKYCLDARVMRQSLKKLLDYSFERMLFAHGTPILSGARARLEQLLRKSRGTWG